MKPIGWILCGLGLLLLASSAALATGLALPSALHLPSPVLVGVAGVLLVAGGYCAMRLSRR